MTSIATTNSTTGSLATGSAAKATAIVFQQPGELSLQKLVLEKQGESECVVDVEWSGISTGTERLLWTGEMPSFPGMGYPLVPGYEAVGRVAVADALGIHKVGQRVFVPGANCYQDARGLFGASSSRLVVDANRAIALPDDTGDEGVLLALAATAYHILGAGQAGQQPDQFPELIVGYGVLGRLLSRIVIALGGEAPTVWEKDASRVPSDEAARVIDPAQDERSNYATICDVSGDGALLDGLIQRLRPSGEVVLAGFYSQPLSFNYPPAFMREARIRVAAEWQADDLIAVNQLILQQKLSLDGLITHRQSVSTAADAYQTAFNDSACLKMVVDWRN